MASEIGFGVVGLGMGRHHCNAIDRAEGARLAAVCDADEKRLEAGTEEFGCRGYTDYGSFLADQAVEVVNIATPSGSHAELGIPAARAGKHLIVEKPADITVERIDAMIAACEENGVKAAGIFQARFNALNIRIREAVASGRLGRLIGVHGHLPWYRTGEYYAGTHGSWKGTWSMDGGGSLMNQGVHTVDLLQWFAGKVESVFGRFGIFAHDIEAEDQAAAVLCFANGALGTLYTTTCCYPGYDQRITLYGDRGSIVKEEGTLVSWKTADDPDGAEEAELLGRFGAGAARGSGAADPMAASFDGHTGIVADMVAAIRQDRSPEISLESARHAVEIINAVYESGRAGAPVTLGD